MAATAVSFYKSCSKSQFYENDDENASVIRHNLNCDSDIHLIGVKKLV